MDIVKTYLEKAMEHCGEATVEAARQRVFGQISDPEIYLKVQIKLLSEISESAVTVDELCKLTRMMMELYTTLINCR